MTEAEQTNKIRCVHKTPCLCLVHTGPQGQGHKVKDTETCIRSMNTVPCINAKSPFMDRHTDKKQYAPNHFRIQGGA